MNFLRNIEHRVNIVLVGGDGSSQPTRHPMRGKKRAHGGKRRRRGIHCIGPIAAMHMGIDKTRHDDVVGGIDDVCALGRVDVGCDLDNFAIVQQ